MFCNACGASNQDNARFCINCGGRLDAPLAVTPSPTPPSPAPPAAASQQGGAWLNVPPAQQQSQTSGKAIASLILGVGNGLFLFLFFPLGVLAVVFGHISRSEIAKSGGRLKGAGMALTGLILGYMSVTAPVILIVAAIAIPNLLSARRSANEASAIGSMRTIVVAQAQYQAEYAKYSPSLTALGPGSGQAGEESAGFIDEALASGQKNGYLFTYTPIDADGDGVFERFSLNADPITPGTTGRRHFYVDETGLIRSEPGQAATAESPQLE